jgi:hypothetical protein
MQTTFGQIRTKRDGDHIPAPLPSTVHPRCKCDPGCYKSRPFNGGERCHEALHVSGIDRMAGDKGKQFVRSA